MSHGISFPAALRVWSKVAALSFGGPTAQIAVMHRVLVDEKKWISEGRFLHALNFCMLLPGPEAQQLATYIGWLMHGIRGGLAAGLLFILPGVLVLMVLSIVYALFSDVTFVQALFYGIKPAVIAVVGEAVVRLSRKALVTPLHVAIAIGAFVAIFFFDLPFPVIIAGAALLGLLTQNRQRMSPDELATPVQVPRVKHSLGALATGLVIWLLPTVLAVVAFGPTSVFTQLTL